MHPCGQLLFSRVKCLIYFSAFLFYRSSVIDMPELVYFFSVQNLDQVGSGRNGNSKTKFGQKIQKVQLVTLLSKFFLFVCTKCFPEIY